MHAGDELLPLLALSGSAIGSGAGAGLKNAVNGLMLIAAAAAAALLRRSWGSLSLLHCRFASRL